MKRDEMIRSSFEYLRKKAESGESFTVFELAEQTNWTPLYARTNISKRIKQFLAEDKNRPGNYTVKSKIHDVNYEAYSSLFKQADVLVPDYNEHQHPDVVVYELFLPLTCEDKLRKALDKLFYENTIREKVKGMEIKEIQNLFGVKANEDNDAFIERVCKTAGNKFGGYSINHVVGRFRKSKLLSKSEAAIREENGEDYLIDETTAVVKFIFPVETTEILVEEQQYGLPVQLSLDLGDMRDKLKEELRLIDWLFRNLFITTILNTVGQEQIWVLEGGKRIQLTRYVASTRDYLA
jgi:hypothetical protein